MSHQKKRKKEGKKESICLFSFFFRCPEKVFFFKCIRKRRGKLLPLEKNIVGFIFSSFSHGRKKEREKERKREIAILFLSLSLRIRDKLLLLLLTFFSLQVPSLFFHPSTHFRLRGFFRAILQYIYIGVIPFSGKKVSFFFFFLFIFLLFLGSSHKLKRLH